MKIPDILVPNKVISKQTFGVIALVEFFIAIMLWQVQPIKILPTPVEVLNAFPDLWSGGFGQELIVSFTLCLQALFLSAVLSLIIAYSSVLPIMRPIAEAATKGRFMGLVGLSFIFTIIAPSGHALKLYMLVFGMSVFYITGLVAAIDSIPKSEFDYARTLHMNEWEVVWQIVIRERLNVTIDILKQNFAIGFTMLTSVEGISRGEGGIGKLLLDNNKHFNFAEIFAIQISVLLLGLLIDYLIGVLNHWVCAYAFLNLERK